MTYGKGFQYHSNPSSQLFEVKQQQQQQQQQQTKKACISKELPHSS